MTSVHQTQTRNLARAVKFLRSQQWSLILWMRDSSLQSSERWHLQIQPLTGRKKFPKHWKCSPVGFLAAERGVVLIYSSAVKTHRKMRSMNTHMSIRSHETWNWCIQLNTMRKSMQSKGKQIISAMLPAEDTGYSEWCYTALGACVCPHVLAYV